MSKQETRTQIIEAALELMGQISPEKFSASKLARAAGVSKATIFHHFQSFDEVPLAALDLMSEQMLSQPLPKGMTLKESLTLLGDRVFELVKKQRHFLSVYFAFFTRALFDPSLKKRLSVSLRLARKQIEALIEEQGFDAPTTKQIAYTTLVVLDGISMHLLIQSNESELKQIWNTFTECILLNHRGGR